MYQDNIVQIPETLGNYLLSISNLLLNSTVMLNVLSVFAICLKIPVSDKKRKQLDEKEELDDEKGKM